MIFWQLIKKRVNPRQSGSTREQNLLDSFRNLAKLKEYKFTLQCVRPRLHLLNVQYDPWRKILYRYMEDYGYKYTQVTRVWADQTGWVGDPPCNKIGYSEPTRFGMSREPKRVSQASPVRLGFLSALWYSILIGWREFFWFWVKSECVR